MESSHFSNILFSSKLVLVSCILKLGCLESYSLAPLPKDKLSLRNPPASDKKAVFSGW